MQIVIASTNLHKVRELKQLMRPFKNLEILTLHQFPNYSPPLDLAGEFAENATMKASHAAKYMNHWVLADDSGLVVPALQSKTTKKYESSFENATDSRQELLKKMEGMTYLKRASFLVCSLALAGPSGLKKCVTALCEGMILQKERGNQGFGYDPLFIKHDYDKSFGELDDPTRYRISHRSKAFEKIMPSIESLL